MSHDSPLQGSWVVVAYRTGDEMIAPDDRGETSLMIEGTLIVGTMGVNRFSGQMEGDLPAGPLATTRMAGPPELMQQEDTLLQHLQGADTIHVGDDGMTFSLNGLLLMELERSGTDEPGPSS